MMNHLSVRDRGYVNDTDDVAAIEIADDDPGHF
jgi:hypothetical protein